MHSVLLPPQPIDKLLERCLLLGGRGQAAAAAAGRQPPAAVTRPPFLGSVNQEDGWRSETIKRQGNQDKANMFWASYTDTITVALLLKASLLKPLRPVGLLPDLTLSNYRGCASLN